MKTIGFIGVGVMGKSMVRNLMKAGFTVQIFARSREKVEDVIADGATFRATIAECVKGCEAVITMVGFPKDVEEVYFTPGAIFDSAEAGAYLIDMTTTSPSLSERLYAEGTKKGFHMVDAPVTGGDVGARNGTLSILVGGDKADFDACVPLFQAMGTNINYQGSAGCGQHAKMANQIMVATNLAGVCEALRYGQAKGLDLQVMLNSLATGAAGSKQLDVYAPRILAGNYDPGFFLKHFVKDLGLAADEAEKSGLSLEVLQQTLDIAREVEAAGYGDCGNHIVMKHYEK